MKETEQNYKDIISKLKTLKNVKPDSEFKNRLYLRYSKKSKYGLFVFGKLAFVSFLGILIFGSGVVAASANTKPGQMLYPLKNVVKTISVKIKVVPDVFVETETQISHAPSPTSTLAPTVAPVDNKKSEIEIGEAKKEEIAETSGVSEPERSKPEKEVKGISVTAEIIDETVSIAIKEKDKDKETTATLGKSGETAGSVSSSNPQVTDDALVLPDIHIKLPVELDVNGASGLTLEKLL